MSLNTGVQSCLLADGNPVLAVDRKTCHDKESLFITVEASPEPFHEIRM